MWGLLDATAVLDAFHVFYYFVFGGGWASCLFFEGGLGASVPNCSLSSPVACVGLLLFHF